jgi:high frequency lysogenization protein
MGINNSLRNRVIALAGIYQACYLVHDTATNGQSAEPEVETCIHSIFTLDSNSVEEIYGGLPKLNKGLQTLCSQIGNQQPQYREIDVTRYVFGLINLERKLSKNQSLLDKLTQGIEQASSQVEYFSETHSNVIAKLAELYQQTISTLTPRILVNGNPNLLSNPEIANRIRALLLAGMRSAVLWRQCGGSRLQFLFSRKKTIQMANELLDEAKARLHAH